MRRHFRSSFCWPLLLLAGLLLVGTGWALVYHPAQAQSPAQQPYDLSWHVIAGGGGQGEAAPYALGGTAAEPGAGLSEEGGYELCAGFWCGPTEVIFEIYLPLLMNSY